MDINEIKNATSAQLEQRMAEIRTAMTAEDADLDKLTEEVDAIEERKNALKAAAEKRNSLAARIANGAGKTTEKHEARKSNAEVTKSSAYADAYARYMRTGDDTECRSLLTQNVQGGQIPVPDLVPSVIETAWNKNKLLSYVRKTYFKGNVKIAFERSATDASWHVEGAAAPDEETLLLGIVEAKPQTVKKWITLSTETIDVTGNGEELLRYIYDEITNKIAAKVCERIITVIYSAPTTSTATAAARGEIATADVTGTVADFIDAKALLSDDAVDLIAIMTRADEAKYKKAALAGSFAIDPFDGLEVVTTSKATTPIVGDLNAVLVNLPQGDVVKFLYDELSLAEEDLVKIVGREPVAIALVKPNCVVTIGTPSV